MPRYKQQVSGDYFKLSLEDILHIRCCDCGLVHDLWPTEIVEYVGKKKSQKSYVEFRLDANPKETKRARRHKRFKGLKLPESGNGNEDDEFYWATTEELHEVAGEGIAGERVVFTDAEGNPVSFTAERTEEEVAGFLDFVRNMVGEQIYRDNPQIEAFARNSLVLGQEVALQSTVTLGLLALGEYAVVEEFRKEFIATAMRVMILSSKQELLDAIAGDAVKGIDIGHPEYMSRCYAHFQGPRDAWFDRFQVMMHALHDLPPKNSPAASHRLN